MPPYYRRIFVLISSVCVCVYVYDFFFYLREENVSHFIFISFYIFHSICVWLCACVEFDIFLFWFFYIFIFIFPAFCVIAPLCYVNILFLEITQRLLLFFEWIQARLKMVELFAQVMAERRAHPEVKVINYILPY